jgi:hypothetical protein
MPQSVIAAGVGGGMSLLGGLLGRGGGNSTSMDALMKSQTNTANQQGELAKSIQGMSNKTFDLSMPAYRKAMDYYGAGMGGNTAILQQLLGPEMGMMNESYKGAQKNLEFTGARGGERVQAQNELSRQKAGQVGNMIGGVRPQFASSLMSGAMGGLNTSMQGMSASNAALGNQGLTQASMANTLAGQDAQKQKMWQELGSSLMGMLMPYIMNGGKGGTPKKAPVNTPTAPFSGGAPLGFYGLH